MTEQWLSIVEYARTFNVSDMTVRRRIKTGRLRAVLKDGKYYIPVSEQRGPADLLAETPDQEQGLSPHAHIRPQMSQRPQVQSTKPRSEMIVVKAHPAGQRTFPTVRPTMPQPTHSHTANKRHVETELDHEEIPASLARPLLEHPTVAVDAKALLAFCEASMRKAAESERRTVEKFKAKLMALEAQNERKEMEISILRQQVEDLQLLARILEKK